MNKTNINVNNEDLTIVSTDDYIRLISNKHNESIIILTSILVASSISLGILTWLYSNSLDKIAYMESQAHKSSYVIPHNTVKTKLELIRGK